MRIAMLALILPLFLAGTILAQSMPLQWVWDNNAEQWNLMRGSYQVGAWDPGDDVYRERVRTPWSDEWSAPRRPPIPTPGMPGDRTPIKGVVTEKTGKAEKLSVGGQTVDPNVFYGPQLPDDSKKPYLLVTGDKSFIDAARPLFAPSGKYASLQDQVTVGIWPLGGWQVNGVGYKDPGVYLLGPRDPVTGIAKALGFQAAPDLEGVDVMVANGLRQPAAPLDTSKIPNPKKPRLIPQMQNIGQLIGIGAMGLAAIIGAFVLPRMFRRS